MIIIKYNLLAAYTKRLYALFANNNSNIMDGISVDPTINIDDAMSKPRLRYAKQFKALQIAKDSLLPKDKFAYFSAEDVPEYVDTPLKVIGDLQHTGHDIVVLYPVVPAKERLASLVLRDNSIINGGLRNCGNDIDCYIKSFFDLHMYVNTGKKYNTTNISFNDTILMSGFDKLVPLHLNKKITLLVLTKETILECPEKIFKRLGLEYTSSSDSDWLNRDEANLLSVRMSKKMDPQRISILKNFLISNKERIDTRYKEVDDIIKANNIEVI